jgi:CheY-like chemotaxis protein
MPLSRLLIADDNPLSLAFFREALGCLGVETVEATDGAQALDSASIVAFDLMLLDARMPIMGGAEVLLHLRSREGPSRNAVALATTADDDPATHAALREAGFVDVLPKPIGAGALRTALAHFMPIQAIHALVDLPEVALDDRQALAAAGGDHGIAGALRGLFATELAQLPAELIAMTLRRDAPALRERLHRLDASAGFCGAPALVSAGARLRDALEATEWPEREIARFLDTCRRTHDLLDRTPSPTFVEDRSP